MFIWFVTGGAVAGYRSNEVFSLSYLSSTNLRVYGRNIFVLFGKII